MLIILLKWISTDTNGVQGTMTTIWQGRQRVQHVVMSFFTSIWWGNDPITPFQETHGAILVLEPSQWSRDVFYQSHRMLVCNKECVLQYQAGPIHLAYHLVLGSLLDIRSMTSSQVIFPRKRPRVWWKAHINNRITVLFWLTIFTYNTTQ